MGRGSFWVVMSLSSTNCLSMKSPEALQLSKESMLIELWVSRVLRLMLTRTEFPLFEEKVLRAYWKLGCSRRIVGNSGSSEERDHWRGRWFLSSTCSLCKGNDSDDKDDGISCNVTSESSKS